MPIKTSIKCPTWIKLWCNNKGYISFATYPSGRAKYSKPTGFVKLWTENKQKVFIKNLITNKVDKIYSTPNNLNDDQIKLNWLNNEKVGIITYDKKFNPVYSHYPLVKKKYQIMFLIYLRKEILKIQEKLHLIK